MCTLSMPNYVQTNMGTSVVWLYMNVCVMAYMVQ